MLEILEKFVDLTQRATVLAKIKRDTYNEKLKGSHGWRRRRVLKTFERYEAAVEDFYRRYSAGGGGDNGWAPPDPENHRVLRLTREIRAYLDSPVEDDLIKWRFSQRTGPVTAYVSNPPNPMTAEGEARHHLRARFGMGRDQQDWWLRAAKASPKLRGN